MSVKNKLITATNAALPIELGFVPARVRVRNLTNLYSMEWTKAQEDSVRVLQLTAAQTPGVTAALDIVARIKPTSNVRFIQLAFADLGATGAASVALSGLGTSAASPLLITLSVSDASSDNTAIIAALEAVSSNDITLQVDGADTTDGDVTAWAFLATKRDFAVASCGWVTDGSGTVVNLITEAGVITSTGIKSIDGSDKVNYVGYSYGIVLGACANINDTTTELLEVTAESTL